MDTQSPELFRRGLRFYQALPFVGAVYLEHQEVRSPGKPFFDLAQEDGETFVWVGRWHAILTPWRRLFAALALIFGLTGVPTALQSSVTIEATLIAAPFFPAEDKLCVIPPSNPSLVGYANEGAAFLLMSHAKVPGRPRRA